MAAWTGARAAPRPSVVGGRGPGVEARTREEAEVSYASEGSYDLVLTPTLARLPLQVGELFQVSSSDPLEPMTKADSFTPFTPLFNITGQPAASLPVHWEGDVPVGVQLVGRLYDEASLLAVCQELEQASGWPLRAPAEPSPE